MEEPFGLISSKTKTAVPLKDVAVEAEVRGYVLGLKSTLKYENASTDPLEVVFRFPLEQSHAVVGLTALIDGRKIRAELKEKEEARLLYDDAIASGQTAALGEEKTGDIFSVSLGNLPPQKEAEIVLQMVGELPIDAEGEVRFCLPTTLKPRYVPAGESNDPLERMGGADSSDQVIQAGVSNVQKFKLSVSNQEAIEAVTSPTHSIAVQRDSDDITVTLADPTQSLASDLVILVKHKHPHAPKALVEQGRPDGKEFMKQSALMINFFPEFADMESLQCEFLFLVDRSGSMSGSINSARETLLLFLKSLPDDCHFNIIGFGSRYVKLFERGSVPYSQATLDEATTHAKGMHANLGGTELLAPLKDILSGKPPTGLSRQVFVLTDGAVSNTQSCTDIVKKNTSTARCFTFGIGAGASTALVEGLARAGNGSAEFIKGGERLQPKVIRSLKRAMQPAVSNVSVKFDLSAPKVSTTYQCPDKLPPVYAGEKLVVYGLVDIPQDKMEHIKGNAILKGEILGKKVQHIVQFHSKPGSCSTSDIYPVHRLAAKALIADWQDAGRSKVDIVSLSVESSVISSHTAFIAIDEENSTPVEGPLKTWDIMEVEDSSFYVGQSSIFQTRKRTLQSRCKTMTKRAKTSSPMKKKAARKQPAALLRQGARTMSWQSDINPAGTSSSHLSALRPTDPTDILSSLIAAQQADGSWQLNSTLSQILSKTIQEVEQACPVALNESPLVGVVWATVLVLAILEKKCKGQQDEWELIAMKANKWLKKQALPKGVELSKFQESAQFIM